jgi:hypothetical protein
MPERIERRGYLTNLRQLGFGECRRFGGGFAKGVFFWVISRFVPPQGETELPFDYDEVEARPEDLSANFHEYHATWQRSFKEAGFRPVGWQKIRKSKDPNHIDSGSVIYLSADSRLVGILNLIIASDESQSSGIRVTEGCSVIAHLDGDLTITATNLGIYLDPRPGSKVVQRQGADLPELHTQASRLADRAGRAVRSFGGWPELRAAMQEDDLRNFLHRRDVRRLFVPKPPSP